MGMVVYYRVVGTDLIGMVPLVKVLLIFTTDSTTLPSKPLRSYGPAIIVLYITVICMVESKGAQVCEALVHCDVHALMGEMARLRNRCPESGPASTYKIIRLIIIQYGNKELTSITLSDDITAFLSVVYSNSSPFYNM